jgi:HlyD family secretion protein
MGLETHEAGLTQGRRFKHERIDPNGGDKPSLEKLMQTINECVRAPATMRKSMPMDDKTQLLRSLAINRQEKAAGAQADSRGGWRAWGLLVLAAAIGGAATAWFTLPRGQERVQNAELLQQQAMPEVTKPEPQRAGNLIASGYVVARRKATIAAEVTGKVVELAVEEGIVVRQGQVLARLDSVLAEKDLALTQSRAEAAEAASAAIAADLHDAERIYNRTRALSQRNISSEADLTKTEARTTILRAQLRQSQAQLATARTEVQRTSAILEKHHIRAPFDGVVVERSAQPGEMISPMSAGGYTRTGICTIVDMGSIEIEVDVNEAFIGRLKPGTEVDAVLDAYPDWTIAGSVIAIVPTANREKATVKVRIGLKEKNPRILPDMAVKVTFREAAATTAGSSAAGAN